MRRKDIGGTFSVRDELSWANTGALGHAGHQWNRCRQALMLDAECSDSRHVVRLRWDHGDLLAYYNITGQQLEEIFYQLLDIELSLIHI